MPIDLLAQIEPLNKGPVDLLADIEPIKNTQSKNSSPLQEALQFVKDFGMESIQSGKDFSIGAANALMRPVAQGINLVTPKRMNVDVPAQIPGIAGTVGDVAGTFGNLLFGGGLLNTARGAAESAPLVGKLAQYLGGDSIPQTALRLGAGNAGYGALMNPKERGEGALYEGALGAGAGALGSAISKLAPSNFFRGNLSPEQLHENSRIASGTETPLGDVIGSPKLKRRYENYISKNFLSGSDEKSASVSDEILKRGNEILSRYLGNTVPKEIDSKVGENLIQASKNERALKSKLYIEPEELAEKEKLKLDLPTFYNTANEYTNLINDQNFLKYEPKTKELLSRLSLYKQPVKESKILSSDGKNISTPIYPTLQESNMLSGKLNSLSRQYGASPASEDQNIARILGQLGKSLKSDIKSSIEKSGSEELKSSFSAAEKNYAKNFSQFLDKDVYKFTHGGKSVEDLLQYFIKTGRDTDKGDLLNKLMSKLDPETKNLVKYAYLSRSLKDGQIKPGAFADLLSENKIGPKQKEALFNDESERKELSDYSKLIGMNSDAISRMFNANNGQRGLEGIALATHILSSIAGSGVGGSEGGGQGAMLGGLTGFVAPGLASRYLTKKITSQPYREALIKKMIESEGSKSVSKTSALATAIMQNIIGGNNVPK